MPIYLTGGNDWKVGKKLMMKYSHKPLPNSPIEKELAVKQLTVYKYYLMGLFTLQAGMTGKLDRN